MSIDARTLAAELTRLRKGRAMRDPQLAKRLGPQTRLAFDIDDADTIPVIRRKVTARTKRLLTDENDHRTAALAALALLAQAELRLLREREAWLAMRLTCDERTARRRVTAAFADLVDALVEDHHAKDQPTGPTSDGHVVRRFRATMHMNTPRPELHEYRTVLVTADRLDAILCRLTVPRSGPGVERNDIDVRVLAGGRITRVTRRSAEHFEFVLELPRPLRSGDSHEYGLAFAIPAGQPMRPHYVFQPLVPCEVFDLTVKFDPARLPRDIWLVDGEVPRLLDETRNDGHRLTPDARGTVRLTFKDLQQGFAYGVRWSSVSSP